MKKFLSLFLVLAMLMGLSVNAFAAVSSRFYVEEDDFAPGKIHKAALLDRNYDRIPYGNGRSSDDEFSKLSAECVEGSRYVEDVYIQSSRPTGDSQRYAYLVLKLKNEIPADKEIGIEITYKYNDRYDDDYYDYTMYITVGGDGYHEDYYDDEYDVDAEGPYVSFDHDELDEVQLIFDKGYITFDAPISSSRHKFDLSYTTDDIHNLEKRYPSKAYLEFFELEEKPSFARGGVLTFFTDNKYLYEVMPGNQLRKLPARFDAEESELTYKTSRLTSYVTSNILLNGESVEDGDKDGSIIKPDTPTKPDTSINGGISGDAAKLPVSTSDIRSAKREGKYAVLNLNGDKIYTSGSDLAAAGNNLGTNEKIIARRVNGRSVTYQWFLDAKNSKNASKRLELGMNTNDTKTKAKFEKWFRNNVAAVAFNHKGMMGINPSVAVKTDISKLNKNTLRAYLYNPDTNKYKLMTNANIYVDRVGYVHFNINEGGVVIITDSALKRK